MQNFYLVLVTVALVAAFIGYEGIYSLKTADDSGTFLYEKNTIPIALMGDIIAHFQRQRTKTLELIIATDPSVKTNQVKRVAEREEQLINFYQSLKIVLLMMKTNNCLVILQEVLEHMNP